MKNILFFLLLSFCGLEAKQLFSSQQEGYNLIMTSYKQKRWEELLQRCEVFAKEYQASDFSSDVRYYEGIAYFHIGDYDLANQKISYYLEHYASEKFFEEAFSYKFEIAQKFESGERLHVFGSKKMPKLVWPGEEIIAIYDEIIKTLPRHELAAKSLFRKASILFKDEDHKEAVEVFQTLIRRFPKHPITPDAYVEIAKVYLDQSKTNFADSDLIDLSEINLRNFYHSFPQDKRLTEAQDLLLSLRDRYAKDIWETAQFFERRNKKIAAVLYYQKVLEQFPESSYAKKSILRLEALKSKKSSREVLVLIEEIQEKLFSQESRVSL